MSNIKTGWLKDNLGDKFAPKTLSSQVMTADGSNLETKINTNLDNAVAEAKSYTDEAAAAVKNDLLNGAGEAYDTLKELGDLINENQDALDALEIVATGKAEKEHIHAISDIAELQGTLDTNAGKIVAGQTFLVDGVKKVASEGAEIFNRYNDNIAIGPYSHAEGVGTVATGGYSHAEGNNTKAIANMAHSEGYLTTASGNQSHAEGWYSIASGVSSHAEGSDTQATEHAAHAEGSNSMASGAASHAEGEATIATGLAQHVQGKYNIPDNDENGNPLNQYAHIVGNGDWKIASNAHTLDWDGNANFAGNVYVGNANENKAGKKLATEEYVNESSKKLVFDSIQLRDISTGFVYLLQIKDGIIVTSSKVTGISMTTQPNKTTYMVGETVDLTGIAIEAACEDGSIKDVVASDVTYYPEVITESVTSIEVKYYSGGSEYIVTVPIRVVASIEELLIDFEYTDNDDGTYTLIRWKQTLNGEPSTEMVIPNNSSIKL